MPGSLLRQARGGYAATDGLAAGTRQPMPLRPLALGAPAAGAWRSGRWRLAAEIAALGWEAGKL